LAILNDFSIGPDLGIQEPVITQFTTSKSVSTVDVVFGLKILSWGRRESTIHARTAP